MLFREWGWCGTTGLGALPFVLRLNERLSGTWRYLYFAAVMN